MTEHPFIAKTIITMDKIILTSEKLSESYLSFLDVLAKEEQSIVDHDIQKYEAHGHSKQEIAARILDDYQKLSSYCESICEAAIERHLKISTAEKLTNVVIIFNEVLEQVDADEISKRIFKTQVDKVESAIEKLVKIQSDSKDLVERNVILVERLIDNHRQSYQFWREAIAKETVGYNEKGRRSTSHSVSMFNARA